MGKKAIFTARFARATEHAEKIRCKQDAVLRVLCDFAVKGYSPQKATGYLGN